MNFYPFHIGDYAAHTRNLSLMEDLAYRRLLDAYYLAERPLDGSASDVARLVGMRDHLESVEYVLGIFFEHTADGWKNVRADIEIERFKDKSEQASRAGRASAERRNNARSTPVEIKPTDDAKSATDVKPTITQEPLPITQEPLKRGEPRKRSALVDQKPIDVDDQTWADWLQLRKIKRAPVTETVIDGAAKEAAKAGMTLEQFLRIWCVRGTQGLMADWLKPNERAARPKVITDLSTMNYERAADDHSF